MNSDSNKPDETHKPTSNLREKSDDHITLLERASKKYKQIRKRLRN